MISVMPRCKESQSVTFDLFCVIVLLQKIILPTLLIPLINISTVERTKQYIIVSEIPPPPKKIILENTCNLNIYQCVIKTYHL